MIRWKTTGVKCTEDELVVVKKQLKELMDNYGDIDKITTFRATIDNIAVKHGLPKRSISYAISDNGEILA